jgi:uncharacterized protein YdcH (DUF465 family)
MDKNKPAVKELIDKNEEFRTLFQEHEELEAKLADLDKYHYLSPQQDIERKRIQKIKLRGRDRMEELLRQAGIS